MQGVLVKCLVKQLLSYCMYVNLKEMKLILLMSVTLTDFSLRSEKNLMSQLVAATVNIFKEYDSSELFEKYSLHAIEYENSLTVDLVQDENEFIRNYTKNPNDAYLLFTRTNPYNAQTLVMGNSSTIINSNFNGNKVTVFLVHGWNGHARNLMNLLLTDAFLEDDDVNVVAVDWGDIANKNYITAKAGVPIVGKALGQFVNWLVPLETTYDKIHMVGFSLGAHITGNAGRETGSRIKRITALDPGGPLWKKDKNRLMQSDARYVEVIHTNTALYGFEDPCGHADFYPNGGYRMPGCILNYCSHRRSYEYMAESLRSKQFLAKECNNLQDAYDDTCYGSTYLMGTNDMAKNRSGIFRVNTNDKENIELYYY